VRNRNRHTSKIFWAVLFIFLASSPASSKDMTINLIAVNATENEKKIDVKQFLPKELEPDDIKDTGVLKMDYDVDKGLYYVHEEFTFEPKESKKFSIKVKDVWVIPEDEVDLLRKQLEKNVESLSKHESYGSAKSTAERLNIQLDSVINKQKSYSENIERRIEEYRANLLVLEKLRNSIYNLDFLKFHSRGLEAMESEARKITFHIRVSNPVDKEQTIKLKHYLPDEVREGDVLDKKGFDVRYDEEKKRAYLTKKETFAPNEEKKFEIVLKDIWQFNTLKLDDLADRVLIAFGELEGSIYGESASYLNDRIAEKIALIRESVSKKKTIREHIGMARVNNSRYQEAWRDFKRIEEMISIVRAKKLEEMQEGKVKNVLQKLKALRGLSALSEALFKKTISITVTWRIIFGTIIFVAVFTTVHFMIWAKRSKVMGEEMSSPNEGITEVPKPGEEEKEEEEEEEV